MTVATTIVVARVRSTATKGSDAAPASTAWKTRTASTAPIGSTTMPSQRSSAETRRVGRSWRALRDNEAVATVMGVSVVRQKATAFAVSSAYAGLAGVMVVWWYDGLLKPDESVDDLTLPDAAEGIAQLG